MVATHFSRIYIAGERIGISLNAAKAKLKSFNENRIILCTSIGWTSREHPTGASLHFNIWQHSAPASIEDKGILFCTGKNFASMLRQVFPLYGAGEMGSAGSSAELTSKRKAVKLKQTF